MTCCSVCNFHKYIVSILFFAATFGFQKSTYTVGEAYGSLKVCLQVKNFAGTPFSGK